MILVVIFIFADILCENYIGIIYDKQSAVQQLLLFFGFALLQIFFAPIQSGFSDLYGRKKSLVVSLSFSLLSLIFVYIYNQNTLLGFLLISATLSKGALGNTLPISLAVMADVQNKNYRLSFAFSTAAYAFAYLFLSSANGTISDNNLNIYLIISFVLIIIACLKLFYDAEDKLSEYNSNHENRSMLFILKNESRLVVNDFKNTDTRKALIAFFLWELSLYSILLTQVDFNINKTNHIAEIMMIGYLTGVCILMLCRKARDEKIIKFGYFISFSSLIPYFLLFLFINNHEYIIRICYFFHTLGNAFLSPAFLSILAKERKPHERGRMYGMTDSVDTCGYLCAAIAIILYKALNLELIYLISFSFITFSLSWVYYSRFKNITT